MRWEVCALILLAACSQHEEGRVAVRNADCILCHTADFEVAETPPHSGILPVEVCIDCHETTAWSPAIFAHDKVSATCSTCHLPDYEQTADPIHSGMFPTTCQDCHITTAWRPALVGVHPEANFPINSGPHEKVGCLDCHNLELGASTDGINTDCIGCHTGEHQASRVNDQHDEVPDYQFDAAMPNFCLECHPNGRD